MAIPAPDPARLTVEVELLRGREAGTRTLTLRPGARARDAVRALGLAPEGAAVLQDGVPVPLDLPLRSGQRLTVVPTFSGG